MIYVLSGIMLLSPLLFTLLIASDLPNRTKFWLAVVGVGALIIIPLAVFIAYGQ